MRRKLSTRLAATGAVAVAATAGLLGGTAQAASADGPSTKGAICSVTHNQAPRYAEARVDSKVIGTMQAGQEVGASKDGGMWQVSHAGNGDPLGYMQPADISCDNG